MTPETKQLIDKHDCAPLVAELLGLKTTAVSDYLNGNKRLTTKEDERVQKVIKRRYEN
jgi:predicted transcriptional regulator